MNPKNCKTLSYKDILSKMEYYCAYQERCYKEIEEKLFTYQVTLSEKEAILIYLIENNYINEERFAKSFARGKHNYKNWGKVRIKNELKFRNISSKIIDNALKEIENKTYIANFNTLAEKNWTSIKEKEGLKKNKKFVDFLLRRGYETYLIYDKLHELTNSSL